MARRSLARKRSANAQRTPSRLRLYSIVALGVAICFGITFALAWFFGDSMADSPDALWR
jgi:hypothetical protein